MLLPFLWRLLSSLCLLTSYIILRFCVLILIYFPEDEGIHAIPNLSFVLTLLLGLHFQMWSLYSLFPSQVFIIFLFIDDWSSKLHQSMLTHFLKHKPH